MTEAEKKRQRAKAAKLSPRPTELPSGRWRCQTMIRGQRISVVEDTPELAHAKALSMKQGILQRTGPRSVLTVGEATDLYIESKDAVLSPATVAGYRRVRDNLMGPILDVRLSELTQMDVQRWVNAMAREKSPKTVRNAHGLLTAVAGAYRPDLALRTTLPQKQRYDVAIPSDEDVGRIITAVRGTENEVPILLAVWLGLRMSEILGLKWSDVDGDVLHIRRALVDEGEKTTKTYSSQRDLPLPAHLRALLEALPRKGDHVVPLTRRSLYSRFQAICRQAETSQHYRFHDLRHINASVMLSLGVPNKYAQQRMGHATENMLKTVYQHTMTAEQQAVAAKVDAYFEGKL